MSADKGLEELNFTKSAVFQASNETESRNKSDDTNDVDLETRTTIVTNVVNDDDVTRTYKSNDSADSIRKILEALNTTNSAGVSVSGTSLALVVISWTLTKISKSASL
ncbi:uncharacterized protein LOC114350961 [Ostrinia furnacalis]|uniref:uncharacterized protein LOC114350961 n=1 Tax=Ostrinia furnacalis TaxID=93504 RepID=UPI001039D6D7|nr:uncharacterized protein LOC114350961 [Ostrinia furnacalis]